MIKNEINSSEYNKEFSAKLLEQRKFNKIRPSNKNVDQLSCTGNGHGPFAEFNDGSVKYDFSNLYEQSLIGYSHPLSIKIETESRLNLSQNSISNEKLEKLRKIPAFNELISAHKVNTLNSYTVELFSEGIFGDNERIESLSTQLSSELSKLKKNNLITDFTCNNLFFSIKIEKDLKEILAKMQSLGLVAMKGEQKMIRFLPPITLTPLHIKEVFMIIKKSLE